MTVQRGEGWVKSATPEQIVSAQAAGELVSYMGGQTAEEQAHGAVVAGSKDRLLRAVYGLTSLTGNADLTSNWFEAKRRTLDAGQLEKLAWIESAPAAEVYAAEQDGSLKHLTGQDVSDEAARLDAVRAVTTAAMASVSRSGS